MKQAIKKKKKGCNIRPQVKYINNDIVEKANIISECKQKCNLHYMK